MHAVLARQLKRAGLSTDALPADLAVWSSLLQSIDRAYAQADDDRYLLERSLALSSDEMSELHGQLAAERDMIRTVICSLAEGVCALNESGEILFINPVARRLLQLNQDEHLDGRRLTALVKARTEDGRSLDQVLSTEGRGEMRLIIAEQENACITCCIGPLGQRREGLVITLHDITERMRLEAERAELNRQLLVSSRHAGMAEVASGVIHNVGNVLNSVNVSATAAADLVRTSKIDSLSKLAQLLDANRGTLAEFIARDPAGAKLPEFITTLAQRLNDERSSVLQELERLRSNVDHIRHIVATQQSYAKGAGIGLKQPERIEDLIDNALRVTEASLTRHHVAFVKDIVPLPPVLIERHHVLQILINLITNAKKAVLQRPVGERNVTVSARREDDTLVLRVIDNGIGIPAENLARIFQHGFTTDRHGHGFGLHSAALAANAIGGSLVAASDGPGRGAIFTLTFPAHLVEASAAA